MGYVALRQKQVRRSLDKLELQPTKNDRFASSFILLISICRRATVERGRRRSNSKIRARRAVGSAPGTRSAGPASRARKNAGLSRASARPGPGASLAAPCGIKIN